MKMPIHPQGARVRVRRGAVPIDAKLIGRTGLVIRTDPYEPEKYGVLLDGEHAEREFAEAELEALAEGAPAPGTLA